MQAYASCIGNASCLQKSRSGADAFGMVYHEDDNDCSLYCFQIRSHIAPNVLQEVKRAPQPIHGERKCFLAGFKEQLRALVLSPVDCDTSQCSKDEGEVAILHSVIVFKSNVLPVDHFSDTWDEDDMLQSI